MHYAKIALAAIILFSVIAHLPVFDSWNMPTYGNTMIHVASARHLLEHGVYPLQNDYSYGGGIPNVYVPGYRLLLAGTALLTGGSFDFASRMIVMLISILLPLGLYLLGKEMFGEIAGLAAAAASLLPSEMLIYTIRPLPQALGLALLPFAFYFVISNKRIAAIALSIIVSLVHQEAGIFLAGVTFAYFAADAAHALLAKRKISRGAFLSIYCWLACTLAYLAWHLFATGNLNILSLAQFSNHEGAAVTVQMLLDKTGIAILALGTIGLAFLLSSWRKLAEAEILLAAMFAVGLFTIKNDLFGINVFMDRFIVYLQFPLMLLAALAVGKLFGLAEKLEVKLPC